MEPYEKVADLILLQQPSHYLLLLRVPVVTEQHQQRNSEVEAGLYGLTEKKHTSVSPLLGIMA